MKLFARLYRDLDETTKTSRKVDALARYFVEARPQDAAWALHFLSGRRIKRLLPAATLAHLALETAGISEWLFGECIDAVGDLAEAAALILPQPTSAESVPLAALIEERVLPLRMLDEEARRALLSSTWALLGVDERLVFHKILTGAFRVGVSELLVLRGIEQASGVDTATLKHRTMGDWTPTADFWSELVSTSSDEGTASERVRASRPDRPYPFALAHPLEGGPQSLGEPAEWQIEWKWDGIRGQLVRRDGIFVWSRGEELVSAQFPEIVEAAEVLPRGVVLDGEILPWRDGVLGFGDLQRRLNRKKIDVKMRAEIPIVFLAYDLLEHESVDVRALPITERRALLDQVLDAHPHERLMRSEVIDTGPEGYATWDELTELREESRARNVEGFMLKRRTSAYGVGRKRGDWWKWKIDPYAVDAVLVYAQHGSGKRASLYTDYTFAVWRDLVNGTKDAAAADGTANGARELVTFAKAYSGLTDDEIKEVDAFVRKNTVEKFGPVRHVKPELVFEIGFEGIAESKRHKSGVAVRFPRMLRWRKDKPAREADTVETLRALLG